MKTLHEISMELMMQTSRWAGLIQEAAELDRVLTQARAVGLEREFELVWKYEMARHRELPSAPPEPRRVLQLVLKVAD